MENNNNPWRSSPAFGPPEAPIEPMEFLSRTWSPAAQEVSRALAKPHARANSTPGRADVTPQSGHVTLAGEQNATVLGNNYSFASTETSFLVMDRILSQSPEISSPRTSGRLSHSCSSFSDSPSVSPSQIDDFKQYCRQLNSQYRSPAATSAAITPNVNGGSKTVGRWLKDRREKKKEEARVHKAQLHATISVAGVAAAVAAMAAATASKNENPVKIDTAVASAAALVAAQCVEVAQAMGADRQHLGSVVSSAVNVNSASDILTLTAAAATALRGAATLKARSSKEVWNIASVIPVERAMMSGGVHGGDGNTGSPCHGGSRADLISSEHNLLGISNGELLARGFQLLKRTRKGDLHWKITSVYINTNNKVMLKMKSRHVAGTITKKKKYVVIEVVKEVTPWPDRELLSGENFRYFGLKTEDRRVIEFECNQREYDVWTQGVSRLLTTAA